MRTLILICLSFAMGACASRPAATTPASKPVPNTSTPGSTRTATKANPAEQTKCLGDNTRPEFGYDPDHRVNPCDLAFIDDVDRKSGGHPGQVAQQLRDAGYASLAKDPVRAIKRFNQAWLLDRNDPETIRAFMDWEMKMGNTERADQFRDRTRQLEKL